MKYTKQDREEVKRLYLEGKSSLTIQRELGIGKTTIEQWARKEGYARKKKALKNNIKDEVIKKYQEGYSLKEVANIFNINSTTTIINWLSEEKIDRRKKGVNSKIKNINYFDDIDTEEKAYYLGFIMADGNVSITNGQYSLKIHISYKDKEIIDGFLKAIKSTNKATYKPHNGNGSYYVSLTSVHMVSRLIELGVVPNKSGNEIIPNMPKELIPHFIRGFFDGDGTAGKQQTGFIANKKMLTDILNNIGIDATLYRSKCDVEMYYVSLWKKKTKILYDYLYKNANIFLQRKKTNIENIIYGNTEVTKNIT